MAILQFGTSVSEFYDGIPNSSNDTTTSDAPYVRRGTVIYSNSPLAYLNWTSTSEVWVSFYLRGRLDDNNGDFVVVYANDDTPFFRLQKNWNSTGNIDFEYYDGSSWTDVKSSWGDSSYETRTRWDFRCKIDAVDGAFDIYKDGRLEVDHRPGDTTNGGARSGLNSFRIGSWGGEGYYVISAVIIADEPTLNMHYLQTWPATDGTYTEWAGGDYTAIDEVGIDDIDLIEGQNNGDRYTYTLPTVTTDFDFGYDVSALCQTTRTFKGADSGNNIRHMVRSGTSDGFGSDQTVSLVKKPLKEIFETDPATGVAWTLADAKNAELGFQVRL